MKYRVDVSGPARHDIDRIYAYYLENLPGSAEGWLVGLYRALFTLEQLPHRCPRANLSERAGGEVRYLLYRDYHVIYEVIGRRVDVMYVRHSSLQEGPRTRFESAGPD